MAVRKGAKEFKYVRGFIDRLFRDDLHSKRVCSLANATLGVMTGASLAVCAIGRGLALARGGMIKHAIKQVDRLLSNPGIDVKELFMNWVPYMVGARKKLRSPWTGRTSMPTTRQRSLLSLLTSHGRATPLLWLTVDKDTLKDNRNRYEYQVLPRQTNERDSPRNPNHRSRSRFQTETSALVGRTTPDDTINAHASTSLRCNPRG